MAQHYAYAVNAAIVDGQFTTPDGRIHLAAANIQPRPATAPGSRSAPPQGCVPLLAPAPPAKCDGRAVRERTSDAGAPARLRFEDAAAQVAARAPMARPRLLSALHLYTG